MMATAMLVLCLFALGASIDAAGALQVTINSSSGGDSTTCDHFAHVSPAETARNFCAANDCTKYAGSEKAVEDLIVAQLVGAQQEGGEWAKPVLFSVPVKLGDAQYDVNIREGDDKQTVAARFCTDHWETIKTSGATLDECSNLLTNYLSGIQTRLDALLGGPVTADAPGAGVAPMKKALLTIPINVDQKEMVLSYFEGQNPLESVREFLAFNSLPLRDDNINVLHDALLGQIPGALDKIKGCRTSCDAANFYCEIICQKWGKEKDGLLGVCMDGCARSGVVACHTGCTHTDGKECKAEVMIHAPDLCGHLPAIGGDAGDTKKSSRSACAIGSRAAVMSGCKRGITLKTK